MVPIILTPNIKFAELKAAMDVYLNDSGKHLPDVVKSKSSYENYRNIMLKVLECNRNESDTPLDAAAAKVLADELYNAGGSRSLGETGVTTATPPYQVTLEHISLYASGGSFINSYLHFLPFLTTIVY